MSDRKKNNSAAQNDLHSASCGRILGPQDCHLHTLNLNVDHFAVLSVARSFFNAFATQNDAGWTSPFLRSNWFFPRHTDHLKIVRDVLALVEAVRCSRRAPLTFSNPRCACCASVVTEAERHFIELIRAMSSQSQSQATIHAMLLCEGNDISDVIEVARSLNAQLETNPAPHMEPI